MSCHHLDQDEPVTVSGPRLTQRPDEEVRGMVTRLMAEEDILRRDQMEMTGTIGDKEMMILLQQRKIAALDEANNRLLSELSRLGDRVGYTRAAPAPKRSVLRDLNKWRLLQCLLQVSAGDTQDSGRAP